MTTHASTLSKRFEKAAAAAVERRQRKRNDARDAGLVALEKMRDKTKNADVRAMLTRQLEQQRAYLERSKKRRADRTAKREARRTKRRAARQAATASARPAAAPAAARVPSARATDFGSLGYKEALAAIAKMDGAALIAAHKTETGRDKPRTTVLEAMHARRVELNA